jgi:fructose-bisphosphate aldolase class 1
MDFLNALLKHQYVVMTVSIIQLFKSDIKTCSKISMFVLKVALKALFRESMFLGHLNITKNMLSDGRQYFYDGG